jgi:phosphate uptake regulator
MILTPDQLSQIADDAMRFKSEPAVERAILSMRSTAIQALIGADPTDAETIRNRQAEIRAIDNFCQELATAIMRAPRKPFAVA